MPRTGTGRVYQRGEQWWIDYSFRGKRTREAAGPRKKNATDLLKKRLAEMGRGRLIGPAAERVTLVDLERMIGDDYRTRRLRSAGRLPYSFVHIRGFFGEEVRALDITADRLTAYVAHRQEQGAAQATIQQELAHLRRAFNLAVRAGRLPVVPPFPTLRVDNARQGFLDGEELERVIRNLPAAVQPVARFASLTGWRRGEVLSRTWAHVNWDRGVVRLEPGDTKNRDGREFPFHALPELREVLERQRDYTRAVERELGAIVPWIFHDEGQPIGEFRKSWRTACRKAGVAGAIFHDLQRTCVMRLERAGVPRSVAMKLTGHKTEAVYRRYAIADAAALAEGVAKLAKVVAHEPERATVLPLEAARG